ncbi:hypothetical protein [Flagellimonas lutaonensis]|uniref:Uncharacterized protein n=1 Tax=Flagellimonas lutaonensis TaxID=516051 RepID=A0A0D5YSA4_9FLAO|nr:hypothetical protein [Allomuricauda lutaonensis]AKA34741.1 hypothetical protein VC82_1097 [Allomuricauda lutaonensis]
MAKSLLLFLFGFFLYTGMNAQTQVYRMGFEHFQESRGDSDTGLLAKLPYTEVVLGYNPMNSRSGLGTTFNFHGHVVVVDQMDVLPDGSIQAIIRREDGRDFFGYAPTLKAILIPVNTLNNSLKSGNLVSNLNVKQ